MGKAGDSVLVTPLLLEISVWLIILCGLFSSLWSRPDRTPRKLNGSLIEWTTRPTPADTHLCIYRKPTESLQWNYANLVRNWYCYHLTVFFYSFEKRNAFTLINLLFRTFYLTSYNFYLTCNGTWKKAQSGLKCGARKRFKLIGHSGRVTHDWSPFRPLCTLSTRQVKETARIDDIFSMLSVATFDNVDSTESRSFPLEICHRCL